MINLALNDRVVEFLNEALAMEHAVEASVTAN
jgi:hypothetical protein